MMQQKWKYIYYDEENGHVPSNHPYKEPYIWSETQPESEYENVTTEADLVEKEAILYPERRSQGVIFSDIMNARLIVLGMGIPDKKLRSTVRKHLYKMFRKTRLEVFEGLWISAQREIDDVKPNPVLQSLIDQYELPVNQESLIEEIKTKIDEAVDALYDE